MSTANYQALIEEAFSGFEPKFRGLEDDLFRLAMAAKALAERGLSKDDFASLQGHRFVSAAEAPVSRHRLLDIYDTAGRYDLMEAAAKPSEWAAELPWDEHLAIIERLGNTGHGARVLRIWRHFIGKIADGYWWWVLERDATVQRRDKGLEPKLGSISVEQCIPAVEENKETLLAALDMAQPYFDRFGSDRDRAWLMQCRKEAMAEKRDRVSGKPDPAPMTEDLFWQIISTGGETTGERLDTLPERLAAYAAKEIKTFGQIFVEKAGDAYRKDIWALAYLMMRGASDDAFEGFRNWLVCQGRATFSATLADADQFDVASVHETPIIEDVLSLVEQAHLLRAGKPMPRLKHPKLEIGEIDEIDFAELLPRIAREID